MYICLVVFHDIWYGLYVDILISQIKWRYYKIVTKIQIKTFTAPFTRGLANPPSGLEHGLIITYIKNIKLCDVITRPCPNFHRDVIKPRLKLYRGWIFALGREIDNHSSFFPGIKKTIQQKGTESMHLILPDSPMFTIDTKRKPIHIIPGNTLFAWWTILDKGNNVFAFIHAWMAHASSSWKKTIPIYPMTLKTIA